MFYYLFNPEIYSPEDGLWGNNTYGPPIDLRGLPARIRFSAPKRDDVSDPFGNRFDVSPLSPLATSALFPRAPDFSAPPDLRGRMAIWESFTGSVSSLFRRMAQGASPMGSYDYPLCARILGMRPLRVICRQRRLHLSYRCARGRFRGNL